MVIVCMADRIAGRDPERAIVDHETVGDAQARHKQTREAVGLAPARGVGVGEGARPHGGVVPRVGGTPVARLILPR